MNSEKKIWAIAGGFIPIRSSGPLPEMLSQDRLCLLNTAESEVCCQIYIVFEDEEPVGPFRLKIAAQRVRHVRINDFIEPKAIPLEVPYGLLVETDQAVIVQFTKIDTSSEDHSICGTIAYFEDHAE